MDINGIGYNFYWVCIFEISKISITYFTNLLCYVVLIYGHCSFMFRTSNRTDLGNEKLCNMYICVINAWICT